MSLSNDRDKEPFVFCSFVSLLILLKNSGCFYFIGSRDLRYANADLQNMKNISKC